jgi:hypothetical protein
VGLYQQNIKQLEIKLATADLLDIMELSKELQDACTHYSHLEQGLCCKRVELGVSEKENLTRLWNDAFLQLRMNALALKQCICERLCQQSSGKK